MATVGQSGALRRVTVHYANSPTRSTVAEVSLDDLDDEVLQFVLADLLPGQEGLHQSFLEGAYSNQQNHMRGAGPGPYGYSQAQEYHGESSTAAAATASLSRNSGSPDEQIASDYEYAKQLQQEMEDLSVEDDDDDDISCVPSPSDSDDEQDHHGEEEEADRQEDGNGGGDDDPDNMTYEQIEALVESVGTEDRGLSDELISYLEPWKYKSAKASGFFSRKTNHEDSCPICLSTFRSRETMITLPCRHHYHAACVTKWLKVNKTCPVCKYELFGPS